MPNYMSGCDENVSLVPEIDTFSPTSMNLTKTDKFFFPQRHGCIIIPFSQIALS